MSMNLLYVEEPEEVIGEHEMSSLAVDVRPTVPATTATTAWDEERWATEILNQQYVRDASTELDRRIRDFLSHADPAECDALETSRGQFLEVLQKAKQQQLKHTPENEPGSEKSLRDFVKEGCDSIAETAYEYTQMLDVMVGQAPEYVALAYGAIKIVLVVQINYTELKVKVREYMAQIRGKFEIIDHLTAYIPTAHLVKAVSQAYILFSRFLAKAMKYYTQSRLESYFKAIAKPWKKFEDIVNSIDQALMRIKEIANYNGLLTTQANLVIGRANLDISNKLAESHQNMTLMIRDLRNQVKAITVAFSKPRDIQETAALLHQRVEEDLDQPSFPEVASAETAEDDDGTSKFTEPGEDSSFGNLLSDVFIELQDYNSESAQRLRAINELPEMKAHRSKQRNIFRMEKVMSWIEADTSQILNVDGYGILRRVDFNTLFTGPLLIFGASNCESVLVLRHFCGDSHSVGTHSYRTLVQALLYQLLQQHPHLYQRNRSCFTRDQASDMKNLWDLLISCIREVNASCTFIVIDSIDALEAEQSPGKAEDKEIVLQQLLTLVEDSTSLVKILLTTRLAIQGGMLPDGNSALAAIRNPHRPQRTLSLLIIQDEMALVPSKLLDIQEKRCKKVSFTEIALLYPLNSIIYAFEEGSLRAFVVTERSGMDQDSLNHWSPLILRAWSVGHNGKAFVRQYHEFSIGQFSGEREISSLKYIPSGSLVDEFKHRASLISRGRKFVALAEGLHYRQIRINEKIARVFINQSAQPTKDLPVGSEEEELIYPSTNTKSFKPLTLMLGPARMSVYAYEQLGWITAAIDSLERVEWLRGALEELVLDEQSKENLVALVTDQQENSKIATRAFVVVLHGPPGVGKTATVRAIAEHTRIPLITRSPADLGQTAEEIGRKLAEFFRSGKDGKAMLLLDNADIFLETKENTERDTMVYVFQRALDLYQGTLFLETNMLAFFHDSITSFLRLALAYPLLTEDAKLKIWTRILSTLDHSEGRVYEVREHLPDLAKLELNGKEINNIYLNAKQLASFKCEALKWDHIQFAVESFESMGKLIKARQLVPGRRER